MKNFRIFLCGDVMTGRGIDQILTHPSKPQLYESFVENAREYVFLVETAHGEIRYPVSPDYIWGDALLFWQELQPNIKIANLETAITQSDDYWPGKGINYRMHPFNINALKTAGIDIFTLANNHILDWNYSGLSETLLTLKNSGIKFCGAGDNIIQAMQPTIIEIGLDKRILVFAVAEASSGTPAEWAASSNRPGLYYLPSINQDALVILEKNIKQYRQPGDLIILSIHWGSNWGYEIPEAFRIFAHGLLDSGHVDVIFGHSSHHPRAIELYQGKPIFYGCGDFINDYEGIAGYESYRGDLTLMYFLDFDSTTLQFKTMTLIPLQINKFKLRLASKKDSEWLLQKLNHSSADCAQFVMQDRRFVYAY